MNSAKNSLTIFGIYMMLIPGAGLMLAPEFLLDLFGLRHGAFLWMARTMGIFAFVIGVFDVFIARHEITQLYKLTVIVRYFGTIFLILLWLTNQVEIMILLFAGIDGAGATWTLLTMKNEPAPAL